MEEERLRALEDDFQETREEIKRILLDIRSFLMQANTPLRSEDTERRLSDSGNPD
jgi:hypothetical protein